ncbi:hypothetical protein X975_03566, partial [Stegodyphus mimosarum]
MKRCSSIEKQDIFQKDGLYYVHSENENQQYCVDMKSGSCTCPSGKYGTFCKHQCAIYKNFDEMSGSFPALTAKDRHSIAYLALGEKTPPLSFYEPFFLQQNYTSLSDAEHRTEEVQSTSIFNDSHSFSENIMEKEFELQSKNHECSAENNEDIIQKVTEQIKKSNEQFSSSSSGLNIMLRRLKII